MSEHEDGGQAFPRAPDTQFAGGTDGMTLRDYFAAKAMATIIVTLNGPVIWNEGNSTYSRIATAAHDIADAMLLERAK